jgi:hypothetical protein
MNDYRLSPESQTDMQQIVRFKSAILCVVLTRLVGCSAQREHPAAQGVKPGEQKEENS